MSFIPKNPLTIPEVASSPSLPDDGTRGLYARSDGWYDVDSDGNVKKLLNEDDVSADVDLSDYYTKEEVDDSLAYKQDIGNMFTGGLTDGVIDFILGEDNYPSVKALKYYVNDKLSDYYIKEEVNDSLADKQDIGNMVTGGLTDAIIDLLGEELYPNNKALKYYVNDKLSSYETKTDFPDPPTPDDEGRITFDFLDMYNKELRLHTAPSVTIVFQDDVYSEDYISGLSFNSGEKATSFDYADNGIINWVGTDCVKSGDLSIFQPSPNTHYDIVFYFNGTQFIGLVNGFVPATGNVVSE